MFDKNKNLGEITTNLIAKCLTRMQPMCKNIFAFSFLEDVSATFIDKTNGSDPTKK